MHFILFCNRLKECAVEIHRNQKFGVAQNLIIVMILMVFLSTP